MAGIEECLRKEDNRADVAKYRVWLSIMIIAGIGAFVGVIMLFYNTVLGITDTLLFGGITVMAYFLKENSIVEYDYALYEDVIAIAKIYNQRRRKELIRVELHEVECIAPVYDERFEELKRKGNLKAINASFNNADKAYFMDCTYNKAHTCVIWEPSEKFLKQVRAQKPRMVRI